MPLASMVIFATPHQGDALQLDLQDCYHSTVLLGHGTVLVIPCLAGDSGSGEVLTELRQISEGLESSPDPLPANNHADADQPQVSSTYLIVALATTMVVGPP